MRFQCHIEPCRRKNERHSSNDIIVIDPPLFARAGKQIVIEATPDNIVGLNKIIFRWVKSGRLTEQEFVTYTKIFVVDKAKSDS